MSTGWLETGLGQKIFNYIPVYFKNLDFYYIFKTN